MTSLLIDKLNNTWVTSAPSLEGGADRRRTRWDSIGNAVFWPFSIAIAVHVLAVMAVNGNATDDFSTVYYAVRRAVEGIPVYNETYYYVDPHYLYNPGATLALFPLGLISDYTAARTIFVLMNAAAIVTALAVLTRMFGFSLRSFIWPATIAAAFCTEAVQNTLVFSNINGLLLLALVVFLWALIERRNIVAGLVLGLAILVKPLFIPLLFLPFVRFQWSTVGIGILVPVIANAIAWPFIPGANDYVSRTMPYLSEVRDYANSSLPGAAVYFGMPTWQKNVWFMMFAILIIIALLILLRYRNSEPLFWACTTSSVLLTGVFFLSSLGQMYYSMLLFPLVFTVLLKRSVMHSWLAWLAVYCFYSPTLWYWNDWQIYGRWVNLFRGTFGWGTILVVTCVFSIMCLRREWNDEKTGLHKHTEREPSAKLG